MYMYLENNYICDEIWLILPIRSDYQSMQYFW